jgi:hypothetical protein
VDGEDLRALLDEEAAEKQAAMLQEIGRRELMRFRIGLDGLAYRPAGPATASRSSWPSGTSPCWRTGGAFAGSSRERGGGADAAVIAVGRRRRSAAHRRLGREREPRAHGRAPRPRRPFLLDPLTRSA